jgi:hypothetical protein
MIFDYLGIFMKEWIEIILVGIMFLGLIGIFHNRIKLKKGIGVRVIQFTTILLLLPTILILALEELLNLDVVATLLGAIVGYVLAGISGWKNDEE